MKKSFLMLACLFAVALASAQSLEDIVKNYTVANKLDKVGTLETIKISASTSMAGMDIPTELWMKNPDKIKSVTNYNGMEIIQVFDGVKGYSVNPMAGSSDPVEMSAAEIKQIQNNNRFTNSLETYLKNGQIILQGEESVNGSPAHKLKITPEGGPETTMYIDKNSYLLVRSSISVSNQGMDMILDQYPADYKEVDGLLIPMKTTTSAMGQEFIQTINKVEVNVPMDDNIFRLK